MKKIVCLTLVLAALTLILCGCGFNYEKEDLTKYIKVAEHSSVKYEELVELYNEYREQISETNKNGYFKIQNGCTVDFKIKAEVVEEAADSVSYTRYEPWSRDGDDYVKGYEYGRYEANVAFDTALAYDVENVTDSEGEERSVQLGKEYSFTLNVPQTYEEESIAGKKIRFTVSIVKILPGISDDAIYEMLTSFYNACGDDKETIEDGDWVVMSFKGRIDGYLFKGGSADNYEVKIGAGYLFEELDRAMLGHKKGEKFTANVTFPENYSDEELAGKEAAFEIEVKNVYNADYTVRNNTEFESEWELKEAMRVLNFAKSIMLDRVVSDSEVIEYPKNLLTQYEKHYKDEVANMVAAYVNNGYTEEQAKNALYGAGGADAYITNSAKADIKEALVAYSIKKEYNIDYTEQEYQENLNGLRVYYYYYYNTTYTNAQIEAMYTKDILKTQFIYRKCADVLFEKMTVDGMPEIPQKAE
ncbi:MAG: FKBP-type peptidyl-prolyl cis-trans isomerase [Clostridia bacterium]|nr:FKBP-type peptidyl-prolyl cis-trans isomerase [Clostridia bacterium]